ncbi:adenylate/guanylate cyclase domain-containing protein [Spirochaetia bacterium 38H-sp]|uniref:Adenylate/guanylate cyclase domain-containing protein n=1 Tax=Rarispira pelagica TaxID=3141764 RepID=A0ABU9UAR7_9SPIR
MSVFGIEKNVLDSTVLITHKMLDKPVSLTGFARFYWKKLLSMEDVSSSSYELVSFPSFWNNAQELSGHYPAEGYGTYYLHFIIVDYDDYQPYTPITFDLREITGTYRLFVNERLVLENGFFSTSKNSIEPSLRPRTVTFTPPGRDFDVFLQVANFDDIYGGLKVPIVIGKPSVINSRNQLYSGVDFFVFGALFIIALYHLVLFFLRRDMSYLAFALFALAIVIRGGLTGTRLIHMLLEGRFTIILIKIEIICVYVAAVSFYHFITSLFPSVEYRWYSIFFRYSSLIFMILLAALPLSIGANLHNIYNIILISAVVVVMVYVVRALINKEKESIPVVVGFAAIAVAVINDVLYSIFNIGFTYMSSYALFFFLLLQSYILSRRYAITHNTMLEYSEKMKKLANAASRFVPYEFINMLGRDSLESVTLGDHKVHDMAVMFSDIRDFTTISEQLTPEESFNFLNSYLNRISPIIKENGGFIDKYLGDGIMALFPGEPKSAVKAGAEMLLSLDEYNRERQRVGKSPIDIGIGLHWGDVVLGTVGEATRMDGTVVSDTVNTAARLEALTKVMGARLLISHNLFLQMPDIAQENNNYFFRFLGRIRLKGKHNSVPIFEIMTNYDKDKIKSSTYFEKALYAYFNDEFDEAEEFFMQALEIAPRDLACRYYLQKTKKKKLEREASIVGNLLSEHDRDML